MSDTVVPRSGRAKTWVLVGSLGVNLLVAGLALGAWLHGPPGLRDLGFGPFDEAFRMEDRQALRAAVRGRAGDLKAARSQMSADIGGVVAALRAEPFDAEALRSALATQQSHLTARMQIGSEVIGTYLAGLPEADRKAFADRIEAHQKHGKGAEDPPKE